MSNAILFSKNNVDLSYKILNCTKSNKIHLYTANSFISLLNDIKTVTPEFLILDIATINCSPEILNTFSGEGCFNIDNVIAIVPDDGETIIFNNTFYVLQECEISQKLPLILEHCSKKEKRAVDLKSKIDTEIDNNLLNELLQEYGFSIKHLGFIYLRCSVAAILQKYGNFRSLNTMIYPAVAKSFHTSVSSVERNIRSAINYAHQNNIKQNKPIAQKTLNKSLTNKKVIFFLVDVYIARHSKNA